jgi:hypothetical protein
MFHHNQHLSNMLVVLFMWDFVLQSLFQHFFHHLQQQSTLCWLQIVEKNLVRFREIGWRCRWCQRWNEWRKLNERKSNSVENWEKTRINCFGINHNWNEWQLTFVTMNVFVTQCLWIINEHAGWQAVDVRLVCCLSETNHPSSNTAYSALLSPCCWIVNSS